MGASIPNPESSLVTYYGLCLHELKTKNPNRNKRTKCDKN